jgi:hypothetical protein
MAVRGVKGASAVRVTVARVGAEAIPGGRAAVALVGVLMTLAFIVAPACFLGSLFAFVLGHALLGLLLLLASIVIGVGATLAGVATGVGVLRRAARDLGPIVQLGRDGYQVHDER